MVQKYDFLVSAIDLIEAQYFENSAHIWYFNKIRDYFIDYHVIPTGLVLKQELKEGASSGTIRKEDIRTYVEVFPKLFAPVDESDYLIKKVVSFCRRQEIRKAFLEYAPKVDNEDDALWDKIQTRVTDACNVGAHSLDLGHQYLSEYEDRLARRRMGDDIRVVPTGIPNLDPLIGGGLQAGQLGIWMAGTGRGKSIALPHCGKRAVIENLNVVHYTLELDEKQISTRYDAAWSGVHLDDLVDKEDVIRKKMKHLSTKWGNSLVIKFYPTRTVGVSAIKAHIRQLKSIDFDPGMIIVDYGDLLKPTAGYNDEYSDLGTIFADLRGIAGELNIPIWTATQVNRAGMGADIIDVEHIGDSLRKAQIADIVIAICMNKEERADEKARLYLAKNRNGPTGVTVDIDTDYGRMCFAKMVKRPVPVQPTKQGARKTGRKGTKVQV